MEDHLAEILSTHTGRRSELIPILQEAQEKFGYLSDDVIAEVAEFTHVPESTVFGVASFYTQFRFVPQGRNLISVCRGTACHVRGAPMILDEVSRQLSIEDGGTTPDLEYTLETVACIGCCALAPCLTVNGKVEAKLNPKKVKDLLAKEKANEV